MTDREKVIKALECCKQWSDAGIYEGYLPEICENCPRAELHTDAQECHEALLNDTIALLKAREPDEDWISRKRLRDEIQYYIEEAGWGDEVNKVLGWCLEFIDNQEAVKWDG